MENLTTAVTDSAFFQLVLVVVIAAGVRWTMQPLEERIRAGAEAVEVRGEQLAVAAREGKLFAVLGGMRSMVANGCWLRMNLAWEKSDAAATTRLLELTVAADERPLYFWLNGARILASDIPEWRMRGPVPAAFRSHVNEQQAQVALRFLEKGLRWRGADPAFYVEMANIHLRRRHDLESASRYYRLAAEQPGAPFYAARIHAELLQQLGRPAEALAWLRRILPKLPEGEPMARRAVVIERVAALERRLEAEPANGF
jgi:tetratricopeptide (TPR) repeat protein